MDHTFIPPPYENYSPLEWYQEAKKHPNFISDDVQLFAIQQLDKLWQEIITVQKQKQKFLSRLKTIATPKGIYMWGGVGRGKSFLMDVFFNCLPISNKRRVHFHAFMAEVHHQMQELKDQSDPLIIFAKQLAKTNLVLCFDEFHISDIADAMILGRLLQSLLDHGLILVATSNYAPDDLYYQGQNRYSFLPTIDLINSRLQIINVENGEDYRLRTLTDAGVFLVPENTETEQLLTQLFQQLNQGNELLTNEIEVLGRPLTAKKRTESSIWFDLMELCDGPRSQQDYLILSQNYRYIFLSGLIGLDASKKDIARRFTWLIDICYDYHVKMCMTSAVAVDKLYPEGDFAEEFTRTASRLIEMQSAEYLKLPHLTLK